MITTINNFLIKEAMDNLADDILMIKPDTLEPIDPEIWEIDSIIDIIIDQEKITKLENAASNLQTTNLTYRTVEKDNIIWITCLLKPRNKSVAYGMGEMGCLQCRVINTFYGLNKLKQLKDSSKIFN